MESGKNHMMWDQWDEETLMYHAWRAIAEERVSVVTGQCHAGAANILGY
jgi:hypothetical protein